MNSFRRCRVCGCTDGDCRECVILIKGPCWWIEGNLCSACRGVEKQARELSAEQQSMLRALRDSCVQQPFRGNYKRMQCGRGISRGNRTANSLRRLRLICFRGYDESYGAHSRGGWFITEFGRQTLQTHLPQ